LCEWVFNSQLICFDTAICNKEFRLILKKFYAHDWFVLEDDRCIKNSFNVSLKENKYYKWKLEWFFTRKVFLKCIQLVVFEMLKFFELDELFLQCLSKYTNHLMIRCEVGFNLRREPIYDEDYIYQNLMTQLLRDVDSYESIDDGFITSEQLSDCFQRCPNISCLSIHNVNSLSLDLCITYLINLKQFYFSESFQPKISLDVLKEAIVLYKKALETSEVLGNSSHSLIYYIQMVELDHISLDNYCSFGWYEIDLKKEDAIANIFEACPDFEETKRGSFTVKK